MASTPDIYWIGASGTRYGYWISKLDASFQNVAGNYIFAKKDSSGNWVALYIGQTSDLGNRLSNHEREACAIRNGATHIHAHTNGNEKSRLAEELDLIQNYKPTCNTQGK